MDTERIADKLVKVAKEIIAQDIEVDAVIDDLKDTMSYQFKEEMAKLVADSIGKSWMARVDSDIGGLGVVKYMKGKGFPDYEEIIETLAKEENMDEDKIRDNISERFFEDVFWDDVQFNIDNLSEDISVLGRMGGYWGLPFDIDMVVVNEDFVREKVHEIIDNHPDLDERDIADEFLAKYEIEELASISPEWEKRFKNLDREIEGIIEDMSSTERWIEEIQVNEWHKR